MIQFILVLRRTTLLLALLTSSAAASLAQNRPTGYVVSLAGDTLRGRVLRAGPSAIALHRPDGVTTYSSAQVRAFGDASGEVYETRPVRSADGAEAPRFVRLLLPGPGQLFTGQSKEAPTRFYLLAPSSSVLYELLPATWQLVMTQQLPVCPGFSVSNEATGSFAFDARNLKAVLSRYNHCLQPNAPLPQPMANPGEHISWGLTAGLEATNYHYNTGFLQDAPSPWRLGYRVGAHTGLTKARGLRLRAELLLQQQQGTIGSLPEYTGTSLYSGILRREMKFTSLQFHALIGSSFGRGKCRPFIQGGLSPAVYLNRRGADIVEYTPGGPPSRETAVSFATSIGFGFEAGAGVQLPQVAGHGAEVEARYGLGYADLDKTGSLGYQTLALQVSVGF